MENSSDDMDSYDVDDYIFGGDPDMVEETEESDANTEESDANTEESDADTEADTDTEADADTEADTGENSVDIEESEEDVFNKIVNYVITHDLALLKDILKKKIEDDEYYIHTIDEWCQSAFKGNTLLMLAVKFGHFEVIKHLLTLDTKDEKDEKAIDKLDNMGLSPLMVAVMKNSVKIVKLLVDKGAKITNFTKSDGSKLDIRKFSINANSNIYKILDTKPFSDEEEEDEDYIDDDAPCDAVPRLNLNEL